MRIAVWHNLPSGGGSRCLYDQVRGLKGRGHHVEVWCPPTADRSFLPLGEFAREHVVPLDMEADSEWRLPLRDRLPTKMSGKIRHWLRAMDRHCRACAEEISAGGFDLLFAHASVIFHPTSIGRHVDIPSALYLQEPNRGYYEQPSLPWLARPSRDGRPFLSYWKGAVRDLIDIQSHRLMIREEMHSAGGYDLILVNSLFSRESILRAYGLESRVCYLGICLDSFPLNDAPKENYVVGLGTITPIKRPDLAIEALGTIEEAVRPGLVWVGNRAKASFVDQLTERAKELGVRFDYKVNVPQSELVDLLGRAMVMIYTPRLEPFGYAPLEANACGTAVVGIAEGGVRETIRDGINGTLVADCEPAALGRAIRDICTDPEKARSMGLAARRNVEENWTLEASLDRLERQLEGLVVQAVA